MAIYFSAVWEFKELHQPRKVSTVFVVGKNKEKITRVLYNQTKTDYKTSQHTRHSTRLKKAAVWTTTTPGTEMEFMLRNIIISLLIFVFGLAKGECESTTWTTESQTAGP